MSLSGMLRSMLPETVAVAAPRKSECATRPLHPQEEALLHPAVVPTVRRAFHLGRLAARDALAGLGVEGCPVLRGPSREPVWPRGFVGAITHTAGHALAAVARRRDHRGVGIDLADLDAAQTMDLEELAKHIARPEERSWLRSGSPDERPRRVLELFSAKESVFKAFFPDIGEYFGFKTAVLRPTLEGDGFLGRLRPLWGDVPEVRDLRVRRRWAGELVLTTLVLPSPGSNHP